ncbi:MAG: hypothetical protein LC781_18970 [Actinobacteria bacterium]|nr:hypothetical protein [Actinomycetota bacterium]
MLRHIDDSVKPWQQPGPRRRLGFALLGVLIALSYALLLASEEAQAKGGKQSLNGESAEGAIGGAAKPVQEAAGEVNKLAGNEGAGGKDVESVAARDPAPQADKPAPVDDGTVRNAARETTRPVVEPALDEATSVTSPALEGETKLPRAEPILDEATTRLPKAEPILEEANPPVEPALAQTLPAVEPALDGAIPAAAEPVGEAVEPVARPLGEEAIPTVGPVLEEASFPGVEPAVGAAAPAPGKGCRARSPSGSLPALRR